MCLAQYIMVMTDLIMGDNILSGTTSGEVVELQ